MKYSTVKNAKELNALIDNSLAGYRNGRIGIQDAAVNVLIHAEKHGDYTGADRLVNGIDDKSKKAIITWFENFGGLIRIAGKEGFSGWQGKEHIKANFQEAKATMYWEYKPAKQAKPFDLNKAIDSLITSVNKAKVELQGNPEAEVNLKVDQGHYDKLVALLGESLNFEALPVADKPALDLEKEAA